MEVRCAGDSPKDSSECVSGAVSVLCLFFIMATPFKGKRPWVKKKIYINMYMYIYVYIYIYIYITNSPTTLGYCPTMSLKQTQL